MNSNNINILSIILGNDSKLIQTNNQSKQSQYFEKINRQLILSSAMFWDSKKRTQKIKTLFLNNLGLQQFDDTQDFKIEELESIELLSLSKNSIIHLQPLSQLGETLISLNISHNRVYDLSPLSTLFKLEQLYASNNSIKNIETLQNTSKLKTLQLYKNKISNHEEAFKTFITLAHLKEIDIEENPICQDQGFLDVLKNLENLKKINGQLNKNVDKIKQLSNSKGFDSSMKSFGTTSMFFQAASNSTLDASRTFYNFYRQKNSSQSYQEIKQKQNILQKLETYYNQIDEQFQKQIIKNVKLKQKVYKIIQNKKKEELEKEDIQIKKEETKDLRKKAKAIKEQLFTKDKKGELLRKLFEVEVNLKPKNSPQNNPKKIEQKQLNSELSNIGKNLIWSRKFQADEIIIIQKIDKYLKDGNDTNLNYMLDEIENTIIDLKSEIDYLS